MSNSAPMGRSCRCLSEGRFFMIDTLPIFEMLARTTRPHPSAMTRTLALCTKGVVVRAHVNLPADCAPIPFRTGGTTVWFGLCVYTYALLPFVLWECS